LNCQIKLIPKLIKQLNWWIAITRQELRLSILIHEHTIQIKQVLLANLKLSNQANPYTTENGGENKKRRDQKIE
jgi:hypothetical protein